MRYLLLTLWFGVLAAQAASGTWTGESVGGRVSVGQQILASRPLSAAGPLFSSATITRLAWHIELLTPPPPGLQIKLCARSVCFPLAGLSGVKQISAPLSPDETFRFLYSVNSRGPLTPALQVISNQLTVNYHTP
ncbi:flagellar protein FlhE [Enterobacter sp. BIGb0383]|uniref:flagellar protein FlhE n=1 Tax=unclassified Enterobacter TaxID=2608935 RepID=UPI000F469FC1|nr:MULTISPECIES: flagellar protein FlhE [unclassified Enterobacter]ROP58320.1 flagellar protein FlhE [Enterobacter sp. BIGb0383]ROS06792.1 flagellar protein FlhE [Enterobacter sp. BIGb0359]